MTENKKSVNIQAEIESNPLVLSKYQIYTLSALSESGYMFSKLKINRAIVNNALKNKIKSIKSVKGVISPCLVVKAKQCLDANLEVEQEDCTKVTPETPGLSRILVLVDGAHRHAAIKELNKGLKEKDEKYENYYYLPLNDEVEIVDILREANVATKPWAGSDFLTNLILIRPDANIPMLKWIQARQGDSSDTAAWLWATLDNSRVYSKSKIIKATTDDSVFKEIAKDTKFENGRKLYEAMVARFDKKIVGLKTFPKWIIGKISDLVVNMNENEAIENIISFSKEISREEAEAIESTKGADKDRKMIDALNDLYNKKMIEK